VPLYLDLGWSVRRADAYVILRGGSMIETAVCGPNTTTLIFKLAICGDMSSFDWLMRLGNTPYRQNRLSRITGALGLEQDS
jgi:hypothetical protein